MSYGSSMGSSDVMALLMFYAVFFGIMMIVGVVLYILSSIGLMKMAEKRKFENPVMAWIPFARTFLCGKIADDVCYRTGKKTNYRKILLGLEIAVVTVTMLFVVGIVGYAVDIDNRYPEVFEERNSSSYSSGRSFSSFYEGDHFGNDNRSSRARELSPEANTALVSFLMFVLCMALLMMVLSIIYMVFFYISDYKIYKDYDPNNAVIYIVVGVLVSGVFTEIVPFILKNKAPLSIEYPIGSWQDGSFVYNQYAPQGPYQQPQQQYVPQAPIAPQPPIESQAQDDNDDNFIPPMPPM